MLKYGMWQKSSPRYELHFVVCFACFMFEKTKNNYFTLKYLLDVSIFHLKYQFFDGKNNENLENSWSINF